MKTLIYIDNLERLHFFDQLMKTLRDEKEFIVITNKLSVYLKTFSKYKTYLLKEYKLLDKLVQKYTFEIVFIWNGATPIRQELSTFFQNNGIRIKFLEISNLPNKLFADPKGTNGYSSLYIYPEILDGYNVSDDLYNRWREVYLQKKSQVKQAKNRHTIRYLMLLDYFGYLFGAIQEDFRNPFSVILNKFKNKKTKIYNYENLEDEYIFFPLQVSNDTQIIEHSDIDNLQALAYIQKRYPNQKLLVKIHPAEENNLFIQEVEKLVSETLFLVSNETKELIKNAKKVITINSTVGLEAMIMDKEVEVLGRALYSKFDQERLKKYICGFLINIDYFGEDFEKKEVLKLYE